MTASRAVTTEAPQWSHRQRGTDAPFAAEVHSFLQLILPADRLAVAVTLGQRGRPRVSGFESSNPPAPATQSSLYRLRPGLPNITREFPGVSETLRSL